MTLKQFLGKQFIDVIQWTEPDVGILAYRYPMRDMEIQPGSLAPPPPDPSELRRKLDCPHCHKPMDTHFYSGSGNVVMESCDTCELNWLDHGKLMRIVHAPEHSYRDGPPMA